MLEQSILIEDPRNQFRSVLVSLGGQLFFIGGLVLLPLIFTEHLSPFKLVRTYIAPQLPPSPPAVAKVPVSRNNLSMSQLPTIIFMPESIPKHVATVDDLRVTPIDVAGVGVVGGTGSPSAASDLLKDLIVATSALVPPVAHETVKPPAAAKAELIRVSSSVQAARLIKKVIPIYPQLAKQARISGTVRLLGVIGKDGTIQNLQLLSGHPLLSQAAIEAVRQWVYRPTMLNGEAVEVMAPIDVIFTLSQ